MKLLQNKPNRIKYTRSTNYGNGTTGEVTNRSIIPTYVPTSNVKAVDVTALTEDQQTELSDLMNEYADYHTQMMKNIPSFESWVELSHPDKTQQLDNMKWRTFKLTNITPSDD
jgi:hypothetical protein